MTLPPSNWRLSQLGLREEDLRCSKCPAMNRPGATVIELRQDGVAYCTVCSHAFDPTDHKEQR